MHFVCKVRKHWDTHSQAVYGQQFQEETGVLMMSKDFATSLNSAFNNPLNDMNFRFLCRKWRFFKRFSAATDATFFCGFFPLAGMASNTTHNPNNVYTEDLSAKLH